jgi:PHD/YefM family antitoxin component YafN of YafNO toxin-antitoxin module
MKQSSSPPRKGNAILLSEKDYKAMMATLALGSEPGLAKKIKEGDKEEPKNMTPYNPKETW